jgi:hypothetical protein
MFEETHSLIVNALLTQLNPEFLTEDNFSTILQLVIDGNYDIFPVCLWMGLNLGEKRIDEVFTKVSPGPNLLETNFWCRWPVISLFHVSEEVKHNILKFLVATTFPQFDIIPAIELFGFLFDCPTHDLLAKQLHLIEEMLLGQGRYQTNMFQDISDASGISCSITQKQANRVHSNGPGRRLTSTSRTRVRAIHRTEFG